MRASANPTWDPTRYSEFTNERLRPALDLLARIQITEPKETVDLGCGPGNITALMSDRWPEANITGLDASAEMLKSARQSFSGADKISWQQADIAAWKATAKPDLIFSNATLHWLGGHPTLFKSLFEQLAPGGTLAVQMPDCNHGTWREILRDLAKQPKWQTWLGGFQTPSGTLTLGDYRRIFAELDAEADFWVTEYLHLLEGEDAVANWTEGAGARPTLDRLPEKERKAFQEAYRAELRSLYPRDPDKKTALPFRRIFLIAERKDCVSEN